jgi:hypothetical protein
VGRALRLILILLLAVTAGCSSFAERKKASALEMTLSSYRTAMRWGQWDSVIGYRSPEAPAVPELDLDNIRVTAYEIRQPPVPVKDDTVSQVVEIRYVLTDEQRVRKLYDKQEWRHDPEANQWSLYSPFPDFR